MLVSVRLFAGLRERAGASHVDVELPEPATVADLLTAMDLAPRSCVAAINREYAGPESPIAPGDEVALVPPVSGGDDTVRRIRVTGEPLDVAALSAAVRDARAGAVVLFEGVTREVPELEYEAYAEMAGPRLAAIAAEEAERHGLCAVAVHHRLGRVEIGEASVVIAVSDPHRSAALDACREAIETLKTSIPLWKKETYVGGEEWIGQGS